MPSRRPAYLATALDVIALMGEHQLPFNEFELRMHQRGYDSRDTAQAVGALERRGWATRLNGTLTITSIGYAAAVKGLAPSGKPLTSRSHRRMPRGLF
jgi:hypothetical protein